MSQVSRHIKYSLVKEFTTVNYKSKKNIFISSRDNYSLLVEELKAAFQSKGKGWLLTAAVPAPAFRVDDGYDVPR